MKELAVSSVKEKDSIRLYKSMIHKKLVLIIVSFVALSISVIFDIMTGSSGLSIKEVLTTIFTPSHSEYTVYTIIWKIRMPIAIMAVIVGMSLGVGGAQMQTILDNPMATPYTLGITSAANFGVSLAILTGKAILPFASDYFIPICSFCCCILISTLILAVSRIRTSTTTVIIAGVSFSYLFNSLSTILNYMADYDQRIAITTWSYGGLTRSTWTSILIVGIANLIALPILFLNSWKITALKLGDEKAKSMGIRVERTRRMVFLVISFMTAINVSFVGSIGFVGLAAPHIVRTMIGEEQRFFMPASALLGALILSLSSVLSKVIIPGAVINVDLITSLIGIPFLLSIVLKRRGD